jgi:hypothetical protein
MQLDRYTAKKYPVVSSTRDASGMMESVKEVAGEKQA